MSMNGLKADLIEIVDECLAKGPGYAQESVVLRTAADKLNLQRQLDREQALLTCWHDLFREGVLSWGYNIDNPNAPFFHRARR
jgi:hypothetical protein